MKYPKKLQGFIKFLEGQGLGDTIESIAQPIAGAIDKTIGTNIKGCGGCAKRRDKLNNLFNKDT